MSSHGPEKHIIRTKFVSTSNQSVRFVESSSDIPEERRIRKCERSEHFRYIKLYLMYYKKLARKR